jgi:hypothetical protein
MEDIHKFIKQTQNVKNYKDVVFSLFQLFNIDKELEAKQEELKELEDN